VYCDRSADPKGVICKPWELYFTDFNEMLYQGCTLKIFNKIAFGYLDVIWWIGLNVWNTKNYGIPAVKCHFIFAFYFLKITSLNWSSWLAVHSCNHDWKLASTAQRHTTFPRCCSTLVTVHFWISLHYGTKVHVTVEIRAAVKRLLLRYDNFRSHLWECTTLQKNR
jgi:hypothetical protein